jgi:two-component sensor histidine kinase
LYADFGNKEMAIHYAEKAIAICERKGYVKLRNGRVASAYARALFVREDYSAAAVEYEKAYTYSLQGMNKVDPKRIALLLIINSVYDGDLQSASVWRKKAEAIHVEPDDEIRYLTATAEGLYGLLTGHTRHSISLLKNAEQLALASNNAMRQCESQLHLYKIYKANGQLKEGLSHYENYVQLYDSLYRSGQEVALIEINGKYQKSLQDEKIATLDANNLVNTSRLLAQKRVVVGGSIALVVLIVLLAALYFFYKKVKEKNVLITRSNEEKNILLKEIHHRVKNNLQVISSLLKLQSGYIKDDAAIQAIAEGRSRVQSMALLHQNLYKEDNLTGVNMKVYFDTLIQGLFDTYNISPDRIKLHKQVESISLDVDTVIPLGLITNELISNALKHAFPGQRHGNLYVDLYESQNKLILKIKDDGEGISKQSDEEGFGTKLIHSLNQKLEAEMTITFDRGMEILIEIHDYKKAA